MISALFARGDGSLSSIWVHCVVGWKGHQRWRASTAARTPPNPARLLNPTSLQLQDLQLPSAMTVFYFVIFSYFLVTAGIAFDIINEVPAVGAHQDPVTGALKPVTFMPYRINGQYIIEGLAGGFLYCLGGALEYKAGRSCSAAGGAPSKRGC